MRKPRLQCIGMVLLVMLLGSSAWAASISGIVTNGTGKSGRIYLTVNYPGGGSANFGASIATAGAFTINGVQPGNPYVIQAFVDTQGNGSQHANDPSGTSGLVTAVSGNVSVGTFAVSTPSAVAALAPQVLVYRGSGGNFLLWDGPQDGNGLPIADKYTISWSTDSSGVPIAGTKDVAAGSYDFFAHSGGASTLYYQVTAVAGATTASSPWTQGPAVSGGSVTGTVYFPGVIVSGPLFVALVDDSASPPKFNFTTVASPVSGGSYTIDNVPAGTYQVYAFLDLNNSGTYDAGDVGWLDNDDFNPKVTVSTSQVTAGDITLNNENASTLITTNHEMNKWGEWYNIDLTVQSMMKQVVNVQLISGPQLATPVDIAPNSNDEFDIWFNVGRPTVGDSYQVKVTYADGTSETVTKAVTGVLDGFATPLAPVGPIPYNPAPTFSWTAPSPAPAEYIYSIWVNENNVNNGSIWDAWGLPGSLTSIVYGSQGDVSQPALTDGISYNWTVSVIDRNGNRSQSMTDFLPTTSPAIGGFTPAGGLAGTVVTINGINFNPVPAANAVFFNGVSTVPSAASSTQLTVTVPGGTTTGRIQVSTGGKSAISTTDFIMAAPITFTGVVQNSANAPVADALIEQPFSTNYPTTTSAADGSFTLTGLFANYGYSLRLSKNGFLPTYSKNMQSDISLDRSGSPYHFYTAAEVAGMGVTPGKGVIIAKVLASGAGSTIAGVVVTAQSNTGSFYQVKYSSDGITFGGSSTYANGLAYIFDVNDWDYVTLTSTKTGWNFNMANFNTHANSVHQGSIPGSAQTPYINNFSPTSGKVGSSVTINGNYFGLTLAENTVKFNGTTATVTGASATALTVNVPSGATTGPISVTTVGGTANSPGNFTVLYTLTTSATGSGGALGTVTSDPVGISCRTSGCMADFNQGTTVNLFATTDGGSSFSGWSGACTGAAGCSLTMNADTAVTATFNQLQYIRNGSNYYSLLQYGFDAAANNDMIQAQAQTFTETDLIFNRPAAQVKFKGGYDGSFTTNSSFTTLDGKLSIRGGALRVDKLKIK